MHGEHPLVPAAPTRGVPLVAMCQATEGAIPGRLPAMRRKLHGRPLLPTRLPGLRGRLVEPDPR
eukprot:14072944-Alexandrium_andersonii.AAC.1